MSTLLSFGEVLIDLLPVGFSCSARFGTSAIVNQICVNELFRNKKEVTLGDLFFVITESITWLIVRYGRFGELGFIFSTFC